jgi:hypothetical protein
MPDERLAERPDKIYVGQPGHLHLEAACTLLHHAFGPCYLVGPCLERRDYRHVDIRIILADDTFADLFGAGYEQARRTPRWIVLSAGLGAYLGQATGLPVDVQVQSQAWSDRWFADKRRVPVGALLMPDGGGPDA